MRFSEAWLREWVNPAISSEELVAQLTMAGLEVDSHTPAAQEFSGVVVGEVLKTEVHPDADKLSVCEVSDGSETFQVVCGANNVRVGLKVPFAKVGAVLGEDFKIKKAKLRGVESFGMLCAAEELGIEEKSDGLLELPDDAPVGEDVRTYLVLNDSLIEVDLTPNRGDCLSIAGLAREVGVLNQTEVTVPEVQKIPQTIDDTLSIEIDSPEDCPRYLGRIIKNINPLASTPLWMQEKLRRADIKCIDPIVDVTNFVLMELGHPMHAFDLSALEGGIKVRRADKQEKLTLLDGKEVELRDDTLVIADHEKALAIAGVMGGLESSVTQQTNQIFLESAFFKPLCIAGKARSYGLQTDAAHRYERGVDFQLASTAMERATSLLLTIVGGEAGPITEAIAELPSEKEITLRSKQIERVLGQKFEDADVEEILKRLGLQLKEKSKQEWVYKVPSWRFDLTIEVDLIEELARIKGYDNLPSSRPANPVQLRPTLETTLNVKQIRNQLTGLGYQEVVTYSFVELELENDLSGGKEPLALANPLSQDLSVMRMSLWSGLLKTLKHNQNRQHSRVRIFESGLSFQPLSDEIKQASKVAGLIWGSLQPEQWGLNTQAVDFFDIKGDVESLLSLTHSVDEFNFVSDTHPGLQQGQTAKLTRNGEDIGWLGALNPLLQRKLDISGKVYLFELDLGAMKATTLPVVRALSKFPSVRRDLAMIVSKNQEVGEILTSLKSDSGDNLKEIKVFDVFEGENIGKDKKSLALGLTFQHPSRTLNDEEINSIIDSGIKALQDKFNVELRM